jgi:hypothetical protein
MADILPIPTEPSRKIAQEVLRRLARMPLSEIASAIDKDESTASRLRSGESKLTVGEFANLLAAIGCKVVDKDRVCVDRKTYEAMAHINARAMRDEEIAKRLMWDDDPE